MAFLLFIIFATIVIQCYGSFQINSNETFENSSVVLPTVPDDDIYKCISYTGAHIDTSHWINQNFSDYKDCQTSGLYNLNRRDRHFKVDIIIQHSWIVDKRGEPLHFNINIWQLQSAINDSNGLCAGPTCSSKARHNLYRNYQRSSYPTGVIVLICNIYIGNYLKSMAPQPWERSLHYNRTIENVQKACRADIQIQDWPHSQPTTLSTSTSRITSTMTSVTFTSTGTLPPTSIIIITTTTESPKTQTLIKTTKVFLTFDYTTTQSNTTNMAMIIGCSTRENIILLGLLLFSVIFYI
ncbi:unnamed protein product [Rotaria sordida]|uniref:Uncharacterized protein n=1 Tax=Rotaria sordida TaxID=392033 RepID=A0A819HF37_9BILA|nr:unnamed protein product [Rotaria sordida]